MSRTPTRHVDRPVALVTQSRALRAVLKAITWIIPKIRTRAFSPAGLDDALAFIEAPKQASQLRDGLGRLCATLSVPPL